MSSELNRAPTETMQQKAQSVPILDLSWADDSTKRPQLLAQLRAALFDVGFLYISNHGVKPNTVSKLADRLPSLFDLPVEEKARLGKLNSPHFLGYSGFAEETTLGKQDQREQFDFATELPIVGREPGSLTKGEHRDYTQLYWRLRGPNQWPQEHLLASFRTALTDYHDAVAELAYRFVHLIEEAFEIPIGTYDHLFGAKPRSDRDDEVPGICADDVGTSYLPPQHRLKLLRYPPSDNPSGQGVGAHKDSSGWLTFLYQHGTGPGLEVLSTTGVWIPAPPIPGTFVVNFGNAFEAATEGAVKATVHRVVSPGPGDDVRYSIPFFMGLPLIMTVS
ncbi:hypothetical protein B0A48_05203 [Cryoendolithus antarcticus]|uniref:Fe2OG dioxygenase domain-containing protein n=1 Tax=Cryoendolithus antarcticus TaxID=1507870 RepID=A0A1V8TI75_9PEZI|nr:hypothetical protein B0A48_05203 [Cryoendolithus antarcticus]